MSESGNVVGGAATRRRPQYLAAAALGLAVMVTGCSDSRSPVSPAGAVPGSLDVRGGSPTVRYYSAVFTSPSPASVAAGGTSSFTMVVTNTSATSPNQDLGYVEIVVPSGFTVTSVTSASGTGGKSWVASVVSGTLQVAAGTPAGQNRLVPGESVTVTFSASAPSACDTYTWTTSAFKAPPSETPFTRVGVQPTVGVTGCATACTYSQGYWKNHASAWPGADLTLGSESYTQVQLLSILNQSVGGNGLISLAHQLIAAKLNIASGADSTAIAATILAADALIGSLVVPPAGSGWLAPSATSALTEALEHYNEGVTGPGHCGG